MKQCPLCGASCFEDMDTCYCCMYRFPDGPEEPQAKEEDDHTPAPEPETAAQGECTGEEPACRQEVWFAGAGIPDEGEAGETAAEGESAPCAFGPSIEQVPGVGKCVRFDIPLLALRRVLAAAASDPVPAA